MAVKSEDSGAGAQIKSYTNLLEAVSSSSPSGTHILKNRDYSITSAGIILVPDKYALHASILVTERTHTPGTFSVLCSGQEKQ